LDKKKGPPPVEIPPKPLILKKIVMELVHHKDLVKYHVRNWQIQKKTIGFVPTMGALHEGHLSLVRRAKAECDVVVVSIFVNPLQFNQAADLEKYPRNLEEDCRLLSLADTDLVYAPEARDFYRQMPSLTMDFGSLTSVLEGEMRPGHFSGVAVVVSRLFHIVEPARAYFGSKDLQQVAVVKRLIRDLDFGIELVACPTARNEDGLALSSRNTRLSPEGLKKAAMLNRSLRLAIEGFDQRNPQDSCTEAKEFLGKYEGIELEYLEWVDSDTMESLQAGKAANNPAICLAARIEGVRLIDNMLLEETLR
jgi:pantoate--beta-alanine ligase